MPQWIERPHPVEWTEYHLAFVNVEHPSSGSWFECDADGNLKLDPEYPERERYHREALAAVAAGTMRFEGVVETPRRYFESGSIRCRCGAVHHLTRGDSRCESCQQLFNCVGQELCEPHMWDERIDDDY